ncbi:MAG: UvrB/UvrC motif-containing protein [Clostridia bacterium]|nr:UvrB/UvrC motif-containing protein [Clostridia bacterium]
MLCENCGKREANVKYTQIINGEKKEMHLCEECSEKLGIGNMEFKMPISFSSFLGDFFDEFENDTLLPEFDPIKALKCDSCGMTFEDFMNTGKFGCANCYNAFESKIDPILKNIQGANRHVGRLGKIEPAIDLNVQENIKDEKTNNTEKEEENNQISKVERLKLELQKAIEEERYEDAAKIRDEIKGE